MRSLDGFRPGFLFRNELGPDKSSNEQSPKSVARHRSHFESLSGKLIPIRAVLLNTEKLYF